MSEINPLPPPDHRLKVPHLVFALLFLGLAGVWALVVSDVINEDRLPVVAPVLLIGAGVIGLAASLASGRNRRRTPAPYVETPDDDTAVARTTEAELETEPTQPVTRTTTDPTTGPTTGPEDDHTEEIR
jgi:hypothetical protein